MRAALPQGLSLALGPDQSVSRLATAHRPPIAPPPGLRNARRIAQFQAGRELAHAALAAADLDQTAVISKSESGAPAWPEPIIGSISHTDGLAAAAVASHARFDAIGLDVERRRVVKDGFESHVCVGDEHRDASLDALTRFSAKEAIFKALDPTGIAPLRFHDVQVFDESGQLGFSATSQCQWTTALAQLKGLWRALDSHVLTLVWVTPPAPTPTPGIARD